MKVSVLLNCSSQKKDIGLGKIVYKKRDNLDLSFNHWEKEILTKFNENKNNLLPLSNLYSGNLWKYDIHNLISSKTKNKIIPYVFSAGLGIRSFNDLAQPYDITFSNNNLTSISQSLKNKIIWLEKLEESLILKEIFQSKNNLRKIISSHGVTFIVLSREYMKVFIGYLEKNNIKINQNIYILCTQDIKSKIYQTNLIYFNESMDYIFDPKSSRLKKRGYSGGIGVRLLNDILKNCNSLNQCEIKTFLKTLDKRDLIFKPKRRKNVPDQEIMSYIIDNIKNGNISANKLHRKLRDEQLWQCEDKRFAQLYKEVITNL